MSSESSFAKRSPMDTIDDIAGSSTAGADSGDDHRDPIHFESTRSSSGDGNSNSSISNSSSNQRSHVDRVEESVTGVSLGQSDVDGGDDIDNNDEKLSSPTTDANQKENNNGSSSSDCTPASKPLSPAKLPMWVTVLEWVHGYLQTLIQAEYQRTKDTTSSRSSNRVRSNLLSACGVLLVALGAILATPTGRVYLQTCTMGMLHFWLATMRTTVGTVIGIALGLGFAGHVYDQLDVWEQRQERLRQLKQRGDGDEQHGLWDPSNGAGTPVVGIPPALGILKQRAVSSRRLTSGGKSSMRLVRYQSDTNVNFSSNTTMNTTAADGTFLEDEQTYQSLMMSAGYHLVRHHHTNSADGTQSSSMMHRLVRGQVLRSDQVPLQVMYPLTDVTASNEVAVTSPSHESTSSGATSNWKAVLVMQELWPTLPIPVTTALGKAVELILRDYIAAWYSRVDPGCRYNLPVAPTVTTTEARSDGPTSTPSTPSRQQDHTAQTQASFARTMMYSIAVYKPLPFYDALYESCAVVFGNLATRVEHVNVLELLLLKWVRILAHTFKTYRALRKNVKTPSRPSSAKPHSPDRQASTTSLAADVNHTTAAAASKKAPSRRGLRMGDFTSTSGVEAGTSSTAPETEEAHGNTSTPYAPVSEIAMTREFLFAGKLHKAVTFGLDVPSLLFTDPNGKECGKPQKDANGSIALKHYNDADTDARRLFTDDEVLAARLFETNVITECEVDYNRVLGHRMVRALVSRADFGSAIVSSILTEIMAGCVLTPIMSLFAPDTINSWILAGLAPKTAAADESTSTSVGAAATTTPTTPSAEAGAAISTNVDTTATPSESPARRKSVRKPRSVSTSTNSLQPVEEGTLDASDTIELVGDKDKELKFVQNELFFDGAIVSATPTEKERQESLQFSDSMDQNDITSVGTNSPIFAAMNADSMITSFALDRSETPVAPNGADVALQASSHAESIIMTLTKALIDLQQFVDFEEFRIANANRQVLDVDWDSPGCRAAVIRLVLVVEAALTHGRCTYKVKIDDEEEEGDDADDIAMNDTDDSDRPVEVTLPQYESTTLTQMLMELTNNLDDFEMRVASDNALMQDKVAAQFETMIPLPCKPSVTDQSTLRTLIAVWLHSGQIHKTIMLLVQAHATILTPYYHKSAFLRSKATANEFARQLRALEGVEVFVDTMYVQASPRLEDLKEADLANLIQKDARSPRTPSSPTPASPQSATQLLGSNLAPPSILSAQFMTPSSTPRHLDFNRNETFAASLRSERERRIQSWERIMYESTEEGVPIIHRKRGVTDEDRAAHVELHHIAKIFFAGTNMLALRDAGRRPNVEHATAADGGEGAQSVQSSVGTDNGDPFALLLVETVCPKRRIEVPDDDSSFLLRAQPRPLNAVGVHRDQRNHDQSFKCFAATYDEPVLNAMAEKQNGGRYIRRCLIRYYPIDRTASVALQNDVRKLDQRKFSGSVPSTITLGRVSRTAPFLSADFLKERHLCNRVQQKGSTKPQSILSSSVMEATDFTSWPRPGKAIEFVYRMTFFERPALDLGGKRFTVADSTSLGAHRADASSLEMSDASLSYALLMMGPDGDEAAGDAEKGGQRRRVEMGKDGYPVIWMKFSRNQDDAQVELKQYRTSFVRAALMLTAARHEAQLRCLVQCVKAGSAKKATKALTDSYLKPTLRLIEYAGSPSRGKQSILLRDLKLGVTHLDRGQLRRNALLSPRYPTELLDLTAVVEDVVEGPDTKGVDLFGGSSTVFTIKCTAIVTLVAPDVELLDETGYQTESGAFAETYKEEWVIHRTMKELQTFHKHLKQQVSMTESSGTAGSRLVGAATAAFSTTTSVGKSRQRKMLIPSLSNATKGAGGALSGVTKKLTLKRKEILESYLGYLLSPGHLLGRCSELLLFLGASFPLSPDVRIGAEPTQNQSDPLGRSSMTRTILRLRSLPSSPMPRGMASTGIIDGTAESLSSPPQRRITRLTSVNSVHTTESQEDDVLMDDDEDGSGDYGHRKNSSKESSTSHMIPAVKSKIDKVMLPQVRNRIFELLRYQFGFENASFARNRLLAALKTASFAVTTPTEFRKLLYKLHTEHLNADAVSGWIHFLIDTLWPNGVFFEAQPVPTRAEFQAQAALARELLHTSFPDQVRTILGSDLTRDGMDILYEMLQNRLVVKSMAYMLFDLLWLEVFPEIGDVLSGGAALDIVDSQP